MPQTLEERVARIEEELKALRKQKSEVTGWRRLVGTFDNDPEFDEIVRLGKAWRDAQIPDYDAQPEPQ